jgi:hypothetical protein
MAFLTPPVAAIVEDEDGQSDPIELAQVLQSIDDSTGIAVAPEYDRTIRLCLSVSTEQPRAISSLKPNILKRQTTEPSPVPILPWLGMIDEELIEEAQHVPGRAFWVFGKQPKEYDRNVWC